MREKSWLQDPPRVGQDDIVRIGRGTDMRVPAAENAQKRDDEMGDPTEFESLRPALSG